MTSTEYNEIVAYLKCIIEGSEFENHTFAVGGAVRDLLMHRPIKDIDLVVDLPGGGLRFAEWMEKSGHTAGSVVTYPTYGTAMFRPAEYPDVELECVQTRGEQYHDRNTRNPETTYAPIEEDAFRRDLTINALYQNVSTGEILDLTGKGLSDIENRVIRCTNGNPDTVFTDDPLRIMRVCRFSARYGWEIESGTYDAMKRNADRLSIITKERIQDELVKILTCDNPVLGLRELEETGALEHVIPELRLTVGMTQNEHHFGDVWEHTLKVVEHAGGMPVESGEDKTALMLAALLHDIGKVRTRTEDESGVHFYKHDIEGAEMAAGIMRGLRFSNALVEKVSFLVREHMRFKPFGNDAPPDKAIRKFQYLCGDRGTFCLCLCLIHADNLSHAEGHCLPDQCVLMMKRSGELERCGEAMFGYKPPLDGHDIMRIRGVSGGAEVGACLDYLVRLAYNGVRKLDKTECTKLVKGFNPDKN